MGRMADPGRVADRWRALTVEQRLSVGVLCVAGIAAFAFGLVQVYSGVTQPFTTNVQQLVELKKSLGPSDQELIDQQKKTDTDGDGISDYDELNTYHTSPYLRDSDSDSISDNIEIAQGTNPNCAEGKNCLAQGAASATEAPTGTKAVLSGVADTSAFPGGGPGGGSSIPDRDPEAIRAYLKAGGVSAAQVDSYTDAELLQAYDESAASSQSSASSSAPNP
jgi:hypothetical protein